MHPTDELRASRDGDQFHYLWAARQSLRLLDSNDDLVLLHVEGVSDADATVGEGDQVVDLAEYRGGATSADARRITYRQFKHSTNQANSPWSSSWLKKTLTGFARKYLSAEQLDLAEKVEFELVTNRKGNSGVLRALENLALSKSLPRSKEAKYLYGVAAAILPSGQISQFYSKLTVSDQEPNVLALRDLFAEDVRGVLPGTSGDEHILLKEMIAARASSLSGDRPYVTRHELLAALRTDEYSLLPAPDEFIPPSPMIDSGQIADVSEQVTANIGRPCVVHAAGGVGKSVLAHSLERALPPRSTTIVYDCFANGAYRRASSARHEAKRAYVQIVNELAGKSLCTPVVPSGSATESDYARMFLTRLTTASESVSQSDPNGLLVVVIDAADSAEVAAREFNGRSFVPQLLREQVPDNVRIVAFCRTERSHLLDPPLNCHYIALRGFTAEETRQHVAATFPSASSSAADEIHLMTNGNPRVQAQILESASSLPSALESLGQTDRRGGELLDDLLGQAVKQALDATLGDTDKLQHICTALAALRPLIPIDVLARLAEVTPAQISSFVSDLGRPILIVGGMVQFRDEPTETWFQQQYKPQGRELAAFLDRLRPLADHDPYAAASLPELLLQSERVEELVNLALTDDRLPRASPQRLSAADSELERRELAQQRAQLALRACLRKGRDFDGARLALRTGALTAGRTRRIELIKRNVDLAAEFLDSQVLEHLVATRAFLSSWPGSNLHLEGALLSGLPEQKDLARVRVRSAEASMVAWVNRPAARDETHDVGINDIAALAWGHLNATDVEASAEFIRRWTPATIGFEAGLIIARYLVDAGRLDELEALVEHGHRSRHLQLSVAQACYEANVKLSTTTLRRLLNILRNRSTPIQLTDRDMFEDGYNNGTGGVVWIVSQSVSRGILGVAVAKRILRTQLSEVLTARTSSYRHSAAPAALLGAALLAHLSNEPFDPIELVRPDVAKELRGQSFQSSWEARDFRANIIPLTPWLELWAEVATGGLSDPTPRLHALMQSTFSKINTREPQYRLLASSVPLAAQNLSG